MNLQNLQIKKDKCYDPRDTSLTFVNGEDHLDVMFEGFKSPKAKLSCGHNCTPSSLTSYCLELLKQGRSTFVCCQPGCDKVWPYEEVRKKALLTPEEMEAFEIAIATNALKEDFDSKSCPGCGSVVIRKNESDLSVRCKTCTEKKGKAFEFCWQCLKEWKGPHPRSDRCDNDGCANMALKTLATCPVMTFESVKGVTGCPSVRACPTCGSLLEHNTKMCKNITCSRCKVEFCFVCLKLTKECLQTSSYYVACSSGVAGRQTSIPVWNKT